MDVTNKKRSIDTTTIMMTIWLSCIGSGEGRDHRFRDFQVPDTPGSPPITPCLVMHSTVSLVAESSGLRCLPRE